MWRGGVVVRALDSRLKRSQVQFLAGLLSSNSLGQVVHTHVPLSPSSIIWYRSRGGDVYGWEGNRRAGVALATRHRFLWFIYSGQLKPLLARLKLKISGSCQSGNT